MVTMATWWIFGKWGELAALGTPGEPPPAKVPGQVLPGHKASSVSLRLCSQPSWPGSFAQPGSPPARDLSRGKAG